MIYIRKSEDRGKNHIDWLNSFFTFSFADYYDPGFMGFGSLRVINEDTIQPATGFGKHPHRNMEIITYVIEGALEHKDSMGTGSIIKPGEIQRMSAGTGVEHSEFNHSAIDPLHLLQIWIIPEKEGLKPSYEQKKISNIINQLVLIGSRDGRDDAVTIHQDVLLYAAKLTPNHIVQYTIEEKRGVWLQLIKGQIEVNDQRLSAGDGAAIFDDRTLSILAINESEFLFFDLKMVD